MIKDPKQIEYETKRYLWRQHCRDVHGMDIREIAGRQLTKPDDNKIVSKEDPNNELVWHL